MKSPSEIFQFLKDNHLIYLNQADKLEDLINQDNNIQSWQTIFASVHSSLILDGIKPEWFFKYIDTSYEYIRRKAFGEGKHWYRFSKTLASTVQYKDYFWHGKNAGFHEDGRISYIRYYKNGNTFGCTRIFKYT